jgi:hypothetical protein
LQGRSKTRSLRHALSERFRGARAWWARRVVGFTWLALWAAAIVTVHRPWRELGGWLTEDLRWLERVVLGASFLIGCFVGSFVRDAARSPGGRPHVDSLRFVWIPPGASAAASMIASSLGGWWPWTLMVLVGFVGYWAGLDAAIGAWPLACGRHYRLAGRIRSDPPDRSRQPELEHEE